jgi:hypothetical protein
MEQCTGIGIACAELCHAQCLVWIEASPLLVHY